MKCSTPFPPLFPSDAQKRVPDINMTNRARCMLACKPGEFLHWKECRCISIDDFTPRPPVSITTPDPAPTACMPLRCPMRHVLQCAVQMQDKNGCPTCRCKCLKVTNRQCPTDCKYGTQWTKDDIDCKICECAPRPSPGKICPPVCAIFCPYGNVLDSDGCPTCSCNSGGDLQPW
ncbi:cysteine-rich motor neuron 1 protein [Elysia marginata]|uniref:Cysteine-rich motor neuron 1 protein n=1 Tax=Elysia marginata TaxID=1093978 RepID=A0AAV4I7N0_9GAST|nr:cysteine-rich motor neuron 1 protein [Elysia marginata]